MTETGFLPPKTLLPRIAPTERCADQDAWPCKRPDAAPLRGVVHDPTARRMGGIAGHAGLVQHRARSESCFARMLLGKGRLGTTRVLSAATRDGDDLAADAAGHDERSRTRLGHRHVVTRAIAAICFRSALVRPHRLHRHELVDRSGVELVRDLPVEPIASGRHGRRRRAAQPHRDSRGGGAAVSGRSRPKRSAAPCAATSRQDQRTSTVDASAFRRRSACRPPC